MHTFITFVYRSNTISRVLNLDFHRFPCPSLASMPVSHKCYKTGIDISLKKLTDTVKFIPGNVH